MASSGHRPAERISAQVVTVDLSRELAALRASASYRGHDHASTTLVNRSGFGAVLVALPRDGQLKNHRAKRSISIQVLEGALRLELDSGPLDLSAGQVASLAPDVRHGVSGLDDSAFLLTMGGEQPDGGQDQASLDAEASANRE